MKKETLKYICCPNCSSDLSACDAIFDIAISEEEIYEGSLLCSSCATNYPIIFGIALLVNDYFSYLAQHKDTLMKILLEKESSESVSDYIKKLPDHIYGSPKVESWDSPMGIEVYAYNQYILDGNNIGNTDIPSFYKKINNIIDDYFNKELINIELGCNTGGILYKSSEKFKYNIGVDLSLASLIKAKSFCSDIYNKKPTYREYYSANSFIEKDFEKEKKDNLDYIIGDIENIPLKNKNPMNISLVNTIDVLKNPDKTIKNIFSNIKKGSTVLITTPYYFRLDRNNQSQWLDDNIYTYIENTIPVSTNELVKIESPWVLNFYPRYFQYWSCDIGLWKIEP